MNLLGIKIYRITYALLGDRAADGSCGEEGRRVHHPGFDRADDKLSAGGGKDQREIEMY